MPATVYRLSSGKFSGTYFETGALGIVAITFVASENPPPPAWNGKTVSLILVKIDQV